MARWKKKDTVLRYLGAIEVYESALNNRTYVAGHKKDGSPATRSPLFVMITPSGSIGIEMAVIPYGFRSFGTDFDSARRYDTENMRPAEKEELQMLYSDFMAALDTFDSGNGLRDTLKEDLRLRYRAARFIMPLSRLFYRLTYRSR